MGRGVTGAFLRCLLFIFLLCFVQLVMDYCLGSASDIVEGNGNLVLYVGVLGRFAFSNPTKGQA